MIEKLLFSTVKIKTNFVSSKEVAASNHLSCSTKFNGELNETICNCLFFTNLSVSWSFVSVCSANVSVRFLFKVTILYSFIISKMYNYIYSNVNNSYTCINNLSFVNCLIEHNYTYSNTNDNLNILLTLQILLLKYRKT